MLLSEAEIMLTKARWEERAWKRRMSRPPAYANSTKLTQLAINRQSWEAVVEKLRQEQYADAISAWLS